MAKIEIRGKRKVTLNVLTYFAGTNNSKRRKTRLKTLL